MHPTKLSAMTNYTSTRDPVQRLDNADSQLRSPESQLHSPAKSQGHDNKLGWVQQTSKQEGQHKTCSFRSMDKAGMQIPYLEDCQLTAFSVPFDIYVFPLKSQILS